MKIKQIAILGSTGSIGKNALRVVEALGESFEIFALSAHNNIDILAAQVKHFKPKVVCISNESKLKSLKQAIGGIDVEILSGPSGLVEISKINEIDIVLMSVVGAAGLQAILAAAQKGKRLAIANKEPLVIAGKLLIEAAKKSGSEILPIDSEHSAIFQSMQAGNADEVNKIILTASGGPFRDASKKQMDEATIEQALAHPTWQMGPKITVDSATMMNKALEVIEAHWLFGAAVEKIEVLIHPESVIHSMVEFIDGSVIAQMGRPDMCLPIQYALTYPDRVKGISEHLRLDELGRLNFHKPDFDKFRLLKIGFEVARTGGTAAAVFNAANESAVEHFLAGRIRLGKIAELIEHCLDKHEVITNAALDELLEADSWARNEVSNCLNQKVH
ncbi:MAG: 1-deoxy-D-xylulose-5-phosphate reductoisomerase [Phycisphaerae bacterium]